MRGQLLGQGIQQTGDAMANGFQEYRVNQQKDQAARGIVTGIISQVPDLIKSADPETLKLLDRFKQGQTKKDDNVYLAGLLATASKQKGEQQQQQTQALENQLRQNQLAELQRQQRFGASLDQFNSGRGPMGAAPQAMSPTFRAAASLRGATGQSPNAGDVTQYMAANARAEPDNVQFVKGPNGETIAQLGKSMMKLDAPAPVPGSMGYEVHEVNGLGSIVKDKATGKPLSGSEIIAQTKPDVKPSEAEIAFDTNISVGKEKIKELRDVVARKGTWETRFGDSKDAATLSQLPYQLAILTAKIVDPSSVAREGEVAAAQKFLIPMGFTADKNVALAAIDNLEKTYNQYEKGRSSAQGKTVLPSGWTISK